MKHYQFSKRVSLAGFLVSVLLVFPLIFLLPKPHRSPSLP